MRESTLLHCSRGMQENEKSSQSRHSSDPGSPKSIVLITSFFPYTVNKDDLGSEVRWGFTHQDWSINKRHLQRRAPANQFLGQSTSTSELIASSKPD